MTTFRTVVVVVSTPAVTGGHLAAKCLAPSLNHLIRVLIRVTGGGNGVIMLLAVGTGVRGIMPRHSAGVGRPWG